MTRHVIPPPKRCFPAPHVLDLMDSGGINMRWFFLLCCLTAQAHTNQKPAVWMLATGPAAGVAAVHRELTATQRFATVQYTRMDVQGVPVPNPFSNVLFVWQKSVFTKSDAKLLGDRLAQWVDQGRGVVLAGWSRQHDSIIGGRFWRAPYFPLEFNGNSLSQPASIGHIHLPGHPLMHQVRNFTSGLTRFGNFRLHSNAKAVANWQDGHILAAVREDLKGRIVQLNLSPDETVPVGFQLIANALEWAAARSPSGNKPPSRANPKMPAYDVEF